METTRQHFLLLIGRVSRIMTRSPTRHLFSSSCAMNFDDLRIVLRYKGCLTWRSTRTTTDFCIRLLITTPSSVFLSRRLSSVFSDGCCTCSVCSSAIFTSIAECGMRIADYFTIQLLLVASNRFHNVCLCLLSFLFHFCSC